MLQSYLQDIKKDYKFFLRTILGTIVGIGIILTTSSSAYAVDQQNFIETAGLAAASSQQQYGVPSSVTVAQAILESGWGESKIATEAKNYFGIKCQDNNKGSIATGCQEYPTRECKDGKCYDTKDLFRVYASMEDSFRDHAVFLYDSPRYSNAFNYKNDPDQFVREIHKAGYATDPEYSDKVINLMKQQNLYRFNG